MARVPVLIAVADTSGNALAGISATVKNRASGANVVLYAAETGPTTVANPLTTDAYGRGLAWADRAPLRIDYAGTGIASYTEHRDLGPSSDGGVDALMLAAGVGTPAIVTSLPGSPVDGQEVVYAADATNGIYWLLKYVAAMAGSYKWVYLGGDALMALVDTSQTTTSATYIDLATVGPSVTVPLAGDWRIEYGARIGDGNMSYAIGGTAASGNDALVGVSGNNSHAAGIRRHNAIAASTAFVSKYMANAGTATFSRRYIRATPIRVG